MKEADDEKKLGSLKDWSWSSMDRGEIFVDKGFGEYKASHLIVIQHVVV